MYSNYTNVVEHCPLNKAVGTIFISSVVIISNRLWTLKIRPVDCPSEGKLSGFVPLWASIKAVYSSA